MIMKFLPSLGKSKYVHGVLVRAIQCLAILISLMSGTYAVRCPEKCQCFHVQLNDKFIPPTYTRVPEAQNGTLIAASCVRQQLTYIPKGFPRNTTVLFLSNNKLSHLNRSMFNGLGQLQTLDVSHNNILSISNDTFDEMNRLEQLDISFNKLQWLPEGFLCPWYRRGFAKHSGDQHGCNAWITAQTQLQLVMGNNPWHCNCQLQEFVEHFSCVYDQAPCIEFAIAREDPIGYCFSPPNMRGTPISRLSSYEGTRKQINVCKYRRSSVDVPLLVTIFTWMAAVLGYVAYFIMQNNRDVANQRSYLSALNCRHTPPAVNNLRQNERDLPHRRSPVVFPSKSVMQQSGAKKRTGNFGHENTEPKKELPTVEITGPNNSDIWIERKTGDEQASSDDYYLQPKARIIQVQPFQNDDNTKNETDMKSTRQFDMYHLSSL